MPSITVSVPPVAKARPRFSARGGKVRTYTPRKTERAEDQIRQAWLDKGYGQVKGPVKITIEVFLARPAGHFGKRGLRPTAPPYPAVRPDLDNYIKTVLDALRTVAFEDDGRVVMLECWKLYVDYGEGWGITVEKMP